MTRDEGEGRHDDAIRGTGEGKPCSCGAIGLTIELNSGHICMYKYVCMYYAWCSAVGLIGRSSLRAGMGNSDWPYGKSKPFASN